MKSFAKVDRWNDNERSFIFYESEPGRDSRPGSDFDILQINGRQFIIYFSPAVCDNEKKG